MGKLSFEDKINLYNDRKSGVSISSLCSKYKILHANVEYLTRLIDKHGYDILRKNRNRKFTSYEKERIINRVLLNNESLLSVAIDEGLSSPGMLANWIKNYKEMGYNIVERKRGRSLNMSKKPKITDKKETIEEENERLKNKEIKQSMSRKGNSMDNGMMENFFGLLKTEIFYDQEDKYKTLDELITAIDDYINYHNHDRIKVKLKGLSPVNYRLQSSN